MRDPEADRDRDRDRPSTWISELAFRQPSRPAVRDPHLVPMSRTEAQAPTSSKRTTVISRFLRRVRVAGQAFADPDSVRREASDLPQVGQGVERAAATHRLGEPAQR